MKAISLDRDIRIMEICGTHTSSIMKSGIKGVLPSKVKLVTGPGCPVCVTPQGYIDAAIELSQRTEVIITTFGDMINVPGTYSSLRLQKALGKDIRVIYSPLQALKIALDNPSKEIVFLGIGFETTAPITALAIHKASIQGITNFSVFCTLKTMPEIIKHLVNSEDLRLDGILCPGHVSTIIGERSFKFIPEQLELPSVIAGFEEEDVVSAIFLLIDMIIKKEIRMENIYKRFVQYDGNRKAKEIISTVFKSCAANWRGLGNIENSGLKIRNEYESFDAEKKFNIKVEERSLSKGCLCESILRGNKTPEDCSFFGKQCTPSTPIGVCMVSREGSCGIHYKYNEFRL
ncbi:hydrogenase formation protein HypD [Clostridium sp. C8-1-8]|uniref:hydrogenase formation protein HypD n=1 Tax=Clostridium sp. C8-1-8 TaxID=2698831 RepID=UPI00136AD778|nr:hydrogenase formation protein HypD [Clostridium sp. C8-1-8]